MPITTYRCFTIVSRDQYYVAIAMDGAENVIGIIIVQSFDEKTAAAAAATSVCLSVCLQQRIQPGNPKTGQSSFRSFQNVYN